MDSGFRHPKFRGSGGMYQWMVFIPMEVYFGAYDTDFVCENKTEVKPMNVLCVPTRPLSYHEDTSTHVTKFVPNESFQQQGMPIEVRVSLLLESINRNATTRNRETSQCHTVEQNQVLYEINSTKGANNINRTNHRHRLGRRWNNHAFEQRYFLKDFPQEDMFRTKLFRSKCNALMRCSHKYFHRIRIYDQQRHSPSVSTNTTKTSQSATMVPFNAQSTSYATMATPFSPKTMSLVLLLLTTTTRFVSSSPSSAPAMPPPLSDSLSSDTKPTKALVPTGHCQFTADGWTTVPLLERVHVSPTSSLLRFALPDKSTPLNLSTCACLLARRRIRNTQHGQVGTPVEDEFVVRPYTPISTNSLTGCFDLLIKDYGPPSQMSHFLIHGEAGASTNDGDGDDSNQPTLMVEFQHIPFNVKIAAEELMKKKTIVMLAGGTGITPMIQALHALLGEPEAKSPENSNEKVILLYGSKTVDDILGKSMLDAWERDSDGRFEVHHVLSDNRKAVNGDKADSSFSSSSSSSSSFLSSLRWNGLTGHIDKELLEKYLPPPAGKDEGTNDDLMILVCGPPAMYDALCGPRDETAVSGVLAELGYSEGQVYKF